MTGITDIQGNTVQMGTASGTVSTPGLIFTYVDGASCQIQFAAAKAQSSWVWQYNTTAGLEPQMGLDASNILTVYDRSATPLTAIQLNPSGTSTFTQSVIINGTDNRLPNQTLADSSSILTQTLADSRYMRQGTGTSIYLTQATSDGRYVLQPTGASTTGTQALALGYNTIAQGYDQTVLGQYNIAEGSSGSWVPTDNLFIIGNGTSSSAPSNAFVVNKNGDTTISGNATVGGTLTAVGIVSNGTTWITAEGDITMGGFTVDSSGTTSGGTGTTGGYAPVISGADILSGTIPATSLAAASVTGTQIAASVALSGTPTAPTASAGTNTTQLATTAFVQSAVSSLSGPPLAQCRLNYSSASAVVLIPYNGNQLNINGTNQTLPGTGVSLSNAGLNAGTLYYIYAYMNSGSMALNASSIGHVLNPATGLQQQSGNANYTFVGWVYTGSGGTFVDTSTARTVKSYFNRIPAPLLGTATANEISISGSLTEISPALRISFIADGIAADQVFCAGNSYASSGNPFAFLNIGIDSISSIALATGATCPSGIYVSQLAISSIVASEGPHTALALAASTGACQVGAQLSGAVSK